MTTRASRLLIVDDNELNRDMLARRLERKGFEVVVADGAEALFKRLKESIIDIILLDIEMPEVSGLEALAILRKTLLSNRAAGHHGYGQEIKARILSKLLISAPTIM